MLVASVQSVARFDFTKKFVLPSTFPQTFHMIWQQSLDDVFVRINSYKMLKLLVLIIFVQNDCSGRSI